MTNEKAINIMRGQESAYWHTLSEAEHKAYDLAVDALEATRWISVKDRLPEDGDAYIVAGKKRNPGEPWEYFTDIAASHGRYIDGFWDTFNDWIEGNEVHITHWMNFPDPPKEEKDDDE